MAFRGYVRPDGSIGVRNYLLIIPTVVCANKIAVEISKKFPKAAVIPHQHGCAQLKPDLDQTERVLYNFGKNGNVGSVLVVGLGCESISSDKIIDEISLTGKPVDAVMIQEEGGTTKAVEKGVVKAGKLYGEIKEFRRESIDLDKLIVGVECGASDTTSGLAANPAVGRVMDKVIEEDGSVIFGETTELIGAEHILARRAVDAKVAEDIVNIIYSLENKIKETGFDVRGSNPTPGNIRAGISTIEEKSLGAVLKAGNSQINGVLKYGERISSKGLFFMDTPGQDIESITGFIAGGAQVIVFTTGLGTPVGSPITPVIKVTGNHRTFKKMMKDIDIDVSQILLGEETIEEAGEKIFKFLLKVLSGRETCSEKLGHHEFAINRIGMTL